jgi:hypothetical protein
MRQATTREVCLDVAKPGCFCAYFEIREQVHQALERQRGDASRPRSAAGEGHVTRRVVAPVGGNACPDHRGIVQVHVKMFSASRSARLVDPAQLGAVSHARADGLEMPVPRLLRWMNDPDPHHRDLGRQFGLGRQMRQHCFDPGDRNWCCNRSSIRTILERLLADPEAALPGEVEIFR